MSFDSQINNCRNNIEKYRTIKSKLNTISSNLSVAANAASDVSSKLSVSYQVNDGDSKVGVRAKNLANSISNKQSVIASKVLPAIDEKISDLKSDIRSLEHQKARAEAERKRKEEEERKKREAAGN